ncbi:MAG: MarR family transcriptional regulator [Lachnospiraceae bacterium]|nr:MarR family transcriptional regulator [Ruminococcus sp.]MCM1275703.1 MarR family transcriptional regulator [Lachnospiraceae bacterium]
MTDKYEALKLKNQLCFPLYACAKEVVGAYKPYLDELNLTYTQYITMMVMWEDKELRVKELGGRLFLDSGTLTPLLKRLEEKGYVTRRRSEKDERDLIVTITESGEALKERAADVPGRLAACARLDAEKALALYGLLYELLGNLTGNDKRGGTDNGNL